MVIGRKTKNTVFRNPSYTIKEYIGKINWKITLLKKIQPSFLSAKMEEEK